MLKFQSPITQNEVDAVLERFDLENRVVVIWSGKDYFDRTFLETYFYQHGLKGLEKIKFFSGISLLDEIKDCEIKSRSKDSIAYIYGIDTTNNNK